MLGIRAILPTLLATAAVHAQNYPLSFHWGAASYPHLRPTQRIGVDILDFTEFGQSTFGPGDPFDPDSAERFSHYDSTVGFNLFVLSSTRPIKGRNYLKSNLLYRSTAMLGYTNEWPSEWLQNDLIHLNKTRDESLPLIGRDGVLEGQGMLGYSGEFSWNPYDFALIQGRAPDYMLDPTPLFLGGGFSLNTVFNDLFVHAGFHEATYKWRPFGLQLDKAAYLSFSGMARAGLLKPAFDFGRWGLDQELFVRVFEDDDLAVHYVGAQASIRFHLAPYHFPMVLELAYTGSSGAFSNQVGSDGAYLPRQDRKPNRGSPLKESFISYRFEIGSLVWETYNDSPGGKDKGPSYGVRLFYVTSERTWDWIRTGMGWL